MSIMPSGDDNLVIQKTDLRPSNPKDPRSRWSQFLDLLRQSVGMKPLYLAERWTTAKTVNVEIDGQAKLLGAKADYELKMAQADAIRAKAGKDVAEAGKIQAEAEFIHSQVEHLRRKDRLVDELLAADTITPEEAIDRLADVIQRIEMHGGTVEFELPHEDEPEDQSDD